MFNLQNLFNNLNKGLKNKVFFKFFVFCLLQSLFISLYSVSHADVMTKAQCRFLLETRKEDLTKKYFDLVKLKKIKDLKIPYLDINPKGKKTVVLIAGFSHSMLVWSEQIELLVSQGYRVVTVEQSNIGLHLKNNGLIDLDPNTGIEYDAHITLKVLKGLGINGSIAVVGHSRGGAVASLVAKKLLEENKKVTSLKLFSPYVRYIWSTGFYTDSILQWWLDYYPEVIGSQLVSTNEHGGIEDTLIDLPVTFRQTGYAYVLKGLQPPKNYDDENPQFETAEAILKIQNYANVNVTIVGAENDKDLAPMSALTELDLDKVILLFLTGDEHTHYWPLDHVTKANEIILNGF